MHGTHHRSCEGLSCMKQWMSTLLLSCERGRDDSSPRCLSPNAAGAPNNACGCMLSKSYAITVWVGHPTPLTMSVKHCLINVDLQHDFIAGSLALKHASAGQDAEEIIPTVNRLIQCGRFDLVVYSLDFHPPDHISFVDNASMYTCCENRVFSVGDDISVKTKSHGLVRQQLWPRHCVQGTEEPVCGRVSISPRLQSSFTRGRSQSSSLIRYLATDR